MDHQRHASGEGTGDGRLHVLIRSLESRPLPAHWAKRTQNESPAMEGNELMNRLTRILLVATGLLAGAWLAPDAGAQVLPLEIRQDSIHYNLSSTNGLPISTTRGVPPGSDGRGPTLAQQQAANL